MVVILSHHLSGKDQKSNIYYHTFFTLIKAMVVLLRGHQVMFKDANSAMVGTQSPQLDICSTTCTVSLGDNFLASLKY